MMNNRVTTIRNQYIYQLRDLVFYNKPELDPNEYDANGVENTPLNIRSNNLGWSHPSEETATLLNDPIVIKLWQSHICPQYFGEDIAMSDKVDSITSQKICSEIFGEFWRLFESRLINTFPRFSKLIKLYQEQENNLLKQLESSVETKARENETPQSSGIDPYDVKYTNHSSTGVVNTKTDTMAITQKLEEIHRMWYSLYEEWANEFSPLFYTKY